MVTGGHGDRGLVQLHRVERPRVVLPSPLGAFGQLPVWGCSERSRGSPLPPCSSCVCFCLLGKGAPEWTCGGIEEVRWNFLRHLVFL